MRTDLLMRLSRCAAALALLAAGTAGVQAAPVTLSNATTSLVVFGGEANNGLVPSGGYFDYTDIAAGELVTWSIDQVLVFGPGQTAVLSNGAAGGFGSPVNLGGGVVRSTATTSGVSVTADTQLIGRTARTTFTFTSAQPLDGTTFVFYAENDIFDFTDDAAIFRGSIGGGDLELFQFDTAGGGLTVGLTGEGVTNASLSLFGAGLWTGFGEALEAGNLNVLSATGSNFATSGDLGLALAFSLQGTSATVIVDYNAQPGLPAAIPEPATLTLLGLASAAAACVGLWRRRAAA